MDAQVLTTPQWSKARKVAIHKFMPRETRSDRNLALGWRLQLARLALGSDLTQARFAQLAGIGSTAYNQWESGENFPSVEGAIKLCERHKGLTLDWIYRGDLTGMPSWLSNAITTLKESRERAEKERRQLEPRAPAVVPIREKIVKVRRKAS